jgi:hypothetical protein
MEGGGWTEAFFVTLGGPQAHDSSGRDDNSVVAKISYFSWKLGVLSSNRIVISTGAYPDFLPRSTGNDRACAFLYGKAHDVCQRHQPLQEIRGSAVEKSAVSFWVLRTLFAPLQPQNQIREHFPFHDAVKMSREQTRSWGNQPHSTAVFAPKRSTLTGNPTTPYASDPTAFSHGLFHQFFLLGNNQKRARYSLVVSCIRLV